MYPNGEPDQQMSKRREKLNVTALVGALLDSSMARNAQKTARDDGNRDGCPERPTGF
jgi:hypothetical protein